MSSEQRVAWLTGFSHLITHGYMTLLPALLVAIASEHSINFTTLGIIANISYFLYGLGAIPAGYLADKIGSKRMLSIGILGMALSSLFVGFSVGIAGFAVSYALLGVFASIHHPAGLSLIARRINERKGRALGFHGLLGNVGLFLAPLAASACVMITGTWRAGYITFGLAGLVFFIIIYLTEIPQEPNLSLSSIFGGKTKESASPAPQPVDHQEAHQVPQPFSLPIALIALLAGSILSGFIFRGSLTFFPTLFQQEISAIANNDHGPILAGYLTTAVLSLGFFSAWFGGYITDKLKRPELFPALIFLLVAPILYCISRFSEYPLIASSAFFSLIYYAWQPSQNYLIAKYTRKASHGIGFGVNFFLLFGMGSAATAVGGYIADDYTIDLFYFIMSVIAAIAMLVAFSVYFSRKWIVKFPFQLVREKE
ncbi:MAG: MFS transporter [Proteobacteria bacterium]|nr:MFS transporter [Pseudomonadota bacterium]MBU1710426.1 MFS transporter [Pseudomonadota bacterium]